MTSIDRDIADSIFVGAIVFAETKATFTPRDFVGFLQMGGVPLHEEAADEILSDLVGTGQLRQVGPGVYAKSKGENQCQSRHHGLQQ